MSFLRRKWVGALVAMSFGSLWLAGCTTDLAAKDFLISTLLRTVFQAIGQQLQANVVASN